MSEQDSAPEQQPAASTEAERRAFLRIASDLEATCRQAVPSRAQGWPGRVHNISRGGLGLLTWHRFRPNTYLDIELRERDGEVRRMVTARVVHATPVLVDGSRYWLLGCAFDEPLSEEDFQALQ